MYLSFGSRESLLEQMPKGGTIAEIGVAEGEFSERILKSCQPDQLHLIDPWMFQNRADYLEDQNNVPQEENDSRYQAILKKFASELSAGQVKVHRDFSHEAASKFSDGTFDWIYVDAMHTFDAVLQDLKAFQSKLKPGGFILGHDYADHINSRRMSFGVVPAVDQFVKETGWQFVLLTLEAYPTYILAHPDNQMADQLARSIVFHRGGIRFPDYPEKFSFSQFVMNDASGQCKVFPEFRATSV